MKRDSYHYGNLKQAFLNEAIDQLKKYGYERLSFRLIAKKLGVASSAPYNHFKNKKELIKEIIIFGKLKLVMKMKESLLPVHTPSEKIFILAKNYFHFSIYEKELFNLMFSKINDNLESLIQEIVLQFEQVVIEKFKDGKRIRITELGAATVAWSMVHGLSTVANKIDEETFEEKININFSRLFGQMSAIWGKGVSN